MNRTSMGIVRLALLAALMTVGAAGKIQAQQLGNYGSGGSATNAGTNARANASAATGNAAAGGGMGMGTGVSPTAMPSPGMSAGGTYGLGSGGGTGSDRAPNDMRANGTALYMSPDPRAPNVTGRAAPPR
ncbi:hypothetical protein LJ655_28985 [Paraburkholderia sp. MMS20-SJTN17]|uniref:Uncharacterized protein n=1 Tax=Paraburkholderia translucens TaxID=2886945 RepID=A0ABS8KM81_9BURK|nr:hypothetical protein [Paraburkholderia sp. MMS20-SJTN17]MCC8405842.1 hypothetical protein [Paraburkholderia sp. MMS20-SJTN17]